MANRMVASLLLLFLFAASAFASSDVPFIVAEKKATLKRIKPEVERISVSIDIYNQGATTVYDVSLNDDSWPQDSFSVSVAIFGCRGRNLMPVVFYHTLMSWKPRKKAYSRALQPSLRTASRHKLRCWNDA